MERRVSRLSFIRLPNVHFTRSDSMRRAVDGAKELWWFVIFAYLAFWLPRWSGVKRATTSAHASSVTCLTMC